TATFNGQSYTTTFDAAASTFTTSSPAGRQTVTTVDALDRPVEEQVSGLSAVFYGYDGKGRLINVTQGQGAEERTFSLSYNADNTLKTMADSLGHTISLVHYAAGRVTRETEPNGQVIGFSYDANGNLTSLTPPGQPAYTLAATPTNLVSSKTAPS